MKLIIKTSKSILWIYMYAQRFSYDTSTVFKWRSVKVTIRREGVISIILSSVGLALLLKIEGRHQIQKFSEKFRKNCGIGRATKGVQHIPVTRKGPNIGRNLLG